MYKEASGPNLILPVRLAAPIRDSITRPYRLTLYGIDLGMEPGASIRQYLGVGTCLVLTLKTPERKPTLLKLSEDLSDIVWLGMISGRFLTKTTLEFRIPPQIWHPVSSQYSGEHYTRGYGKHYSLGPGKPNYTLLYLPAFDLSGIIQQSYLIPEVAH